jgi:hypothetical protein
VVSLTEIAKRRRAIEGERQVRAEMLWVGRSVGMEIYEIMMRDPNVPMMTNPFAGLHHAGPYGLDLNIDDDLPRDVWRLADEHGTLLYDCREGTSPA